MARAHWFFYDPKGIFIFLEMSCRWSKHELQTSKRIKSIPSFIITHRLLLKEMWRKSFLADWFSSKLAAMRIATGQVRWACCVEVGCPMQSILLDGAVKRDSQSDGVQNKLKRSLFRTASAEAPGLCNPRLPLRCGSGLRDGRSGDLRQP